MTAPGEIKMLIAAILTSAHRALAPVELLDTTDLRQAGLIDSLGFVRLLAELEQQLGGPIDLASLDPDRLTHVGSLCRHIAAQRLQA